MCIVSFVCTKSTFNKLRYVRDDTFFRLAALDVSNHFFPVKDFRFTKKTEGGKAPVDAIQTEVLCQPILEFILLLTRSGTS